MKTLWELIKSARLELSIAENELASSVVHLWRFWPGRRKHTGWAKNLVMQNLHSMHVRQREISHGCLVLFQVLNCNVSLFLPEPWTCRTAVTVLVLRVHWSRILQKTPAGLDLDHLYYSKPSLIWSNIVKICKCQYFCPKFFKRLPLDNFDWDNGILVSNSSKGPPLEP